MTIHIAPREPGRFRKLYNAAWFRLWRLGLVGRGYRQIGYTTDAEDDA